jgi:AraC-like DNA-binding protein
LIIITLARMKYTEYQPGPEFASVVERFWLLEGAPGVPDAIIPDGRIELIVHYSGAFWRHRSPAAPIRQPSLLLVGQMIEPVVLAAEGWSGIAAIRLKPAGARAVLGFAASEVAGRFVELDAVFPSARALIDLLASARDDAERIGTLEAWLRRIVRQPPRSQVEAAVAAIVHSGGRASIDRIAARTGLGVRQIERSFNEDVGLGPKTFARIVRLQVALQSIRQGRTLSDVALACGYYDQAHMARDFRQLAAMSPAVWQAHAGELTPLFLFNPS